MIVRRVHKKSQDAERSGESRFDSYDAPRLGAQRFEDGLITSVATVTARRDEYWRHGVQGDPVTASSRSWSSS